MLLDLYVKGKTLLWGARDKITNEDGAVATEYGLLLVLVPWSPFWERNYFADAWPLVRLVVTNNFVRGAISGLGVVNLIAGFEAGGLWSVDGDALPTAAELAKGSAGGRLVGDF